MLSYRRWDISFNSPFEYFHPQVFLALKTHSSLKGKAFKFVESKVQFSILHLCKSILSSYFAKFSDIKN